MFKNNVLNERTKRDIFSFIYSMILLLLLFSANSCRFIKFHSNSWWLIYKGGVPFCCLQIQIQYDTAREGPVIITRTDWHSVFSRFGKKTEDSFHFGIWETMDGAFLRFHSETRLSEQPIISQGHVEGNEMVISEDSGGIKVERRLQFSGVLLGPRGASQSLSKKLINLGDTFSYKTFSPDVGMILDAHYKYEGNETITIDTQNIITKRIVETCDQMPIARTIWLDPEGTMVKSVEPSPTGDIISLRSYRPVGLSDLRPVEVADEGQSELNSRANVYLPQQRQIDSLTIRLTHHKPEIGWPDLEGGYQHVLEKKRDCLILKILRPQLGKGRTLQIDRDYYLKSNAYVQCDDPEVIKIAKEVAAGVIDPYRQAVRLKNWVAENVQFDLGIVMAPAGEVIRNRRGTCTASAVLLAAMARALGIPSRIASGTVFLNGMWGGHAWSEVFISGQWLPLDAALNGPGIADAARFFVSHTSLNEGLVAEIAMNIMKSGYFEVSIQEFSLGVKRVIVNQTIPVHRINGELYENPGLGLIIRKPTGFRFLDLHKSFKDGLLLEMKENWLSKFTIWQDRWLPRPTVEAWAADVIRGHLGANVKITKIKPNIFKGIKGSQTALAIMNGSDIYVILGRWYMEDNKLDEMLKGFLLKERLKPALEK